MDPAILNAIVFQNKPKRVYKANRSAAVAFNDAKRVHTALREFNDLSANQVFQNLMSKLEDMEDDKTFKSVGKFGIPTKRGTMSSVAEMKAKAQDFFDEARGRTGTTVGGAEFEPVGQAALENILDLEETTQEDIIKNVEVMLNQQTKQNEVMRKDKKKDQGGFDLNTGVIAAVKAAPAAAKTAPPKPTPAQAKAEP